MYIVTVRYIVHVCLCVCSCVWMCIADSAGSVWQRPTLPEEATPLPSGHLQESQRYSHSLPVVRHTPFTLYFFSFSWIPSQSTVSTISRGAYTQCVYMCMVRCTLYLSVSLSLSLSLSLSFSLSLSLSVCVCLSGS